MFLDLKTARKLLGEEAIIGVTVASIEEAMIACEDGADYLGIGTIFATPTYVIAAFFETHSLRSILTPTFTPPLPCSPCDFLYSLASSVTRTSPIHVLPSSDTTQAKPTPRAS